MSLTKGLVTSSKLNAMPPLGKIPNNQLPQIYNNHAIYVICSHYEGNPKTLLEAMGLALEDIAAAQLVYNKAKGQGIGQELPFQTRDRKAAAVSAAAIKRD